MKTYRQKHPYIAQIGYILRYKLQRFTWMFKVKICASHIRKAHIADCSLK